VSANTTSRTLQTRSLDTVRTRRQRWAYTDVVPMGVATILAGRGGIGKSTILSWLVAGLTQGTMPGDLRGQPVNVGLIAGEDDAATTLVPRLTVAGAELSRTFDLSNVKNVADDGSEWESLPTIADDLASLRHAIRQHNIRVLVIDPVVSTMNGDTVKVSDVRRNIDPIASLCADLDVAAILVMHFGKGGGNASDKLSGSHAFRDIARSVLLLAIDEETGDRILTVDKSNYSPRLPSFAFSIADKGYTTHDGEPTTIGRAALLGETPLTVQALIDRQDTRPMGERSADILDMLADATEPITPKDVEDELGIPNRQASQYLMRLVDRGQAERTGRGKYTTVHARTPVDSVDSVDSSS
jgi:hypothetical protein